MKRYSKLERRHFPAIYLFLLPTLILFALFYVVPIVTVFFTSFTKWNGFNAPQFSVDTIFYNYKKLFSMTSFSKALRNLGLWSLIAATLHVGISALVALILCQKPVGWKFVRSVYMIPNVISAAAWAMIDQLIFNNDFGLLNNLIRLVNPSFNVNWFYQSPAAFWAVTFTWLFYAVIVCLIVLADMMAIPRELHEAAEIDGASFLRIFWQINVPLAKTGLSTAGILMFLGNWSEYYYAALLTSSASNRTLPVSLAFFNQAFSYDYTRMIAALTLVVMPGIIIYMLAQEQVQASVAASGVKG